MSGTLGKMAPTATVFALAAWCCWPYLEGPRPATGVQQGGDLPRIAGPMLSPTLQPAPERNPFQPLRANEEIPPEGKEPATPADREEAVAEEDAIDVFRDLVLGGIFIHGERRMAVINGQVYEQGDSLAISASATKRCVVAEISADKARLVYRGETVELKYAGLTFGADPTEPEEQPDE